VLLSVVCAGSLLSAVVWLPRVAGAMFWFSKKPPHTSLYSSLF